METEIESRWISRKAATKYCGLSLSTIDLLIRKRAFVSKKLGHNCLIDRASLDAWIENGQESDSDFVPVEVSLPREQLDYLAAQLLPQIESLLERTFADLASSRSWVTNAQLVPRWLTRRTAKAYTSLSITTISRHMREKQFVTKKVGRVRLIDRQSLDAWIEQKPF